MKNRFEVRLEELRKRSDKGFTLMEMLIVIAIIAVLIAIAIPVFTGQLENSREATDGSNIRSAYSEIMVRVATDPRASKVQASKFNISKLQQAQDGWQNSAVKNGLEELDHSAVDKADLDVDVDISGVKAAGKVTFTYTKGTSSDSPSLKITAS